MSDLSCFYFLTSAHSLANCDQNVDVMAHCQKSYLVWMSLMLLTPCCQSHGFSQVKDEIGYICHVDPTFGVVPVNSVIQCALLCMNGAQHRCTTFRVFNDTSGMKCTHCIKGCGRDTVMASDGIIYSQSISTKTDPPAGNFHSLQLIILSSYM